MNKPRNLLKNFLLAIASSILAIVLFECVIRFFVTPSPMSYGILFGGELPPIKVIPARESTRFEVQDAAESERTSPQTIANSTNGDGDAPKQQDVGEDDLWGILRQDPLLGYVPKENSVSSNRWWQSNNLGARSRSETSPTIPTGKKRILVFGESFTNCSRVHQDDAWPAILEATNREFEVLNFGVDGYGMAQSFLRYRAVKTTIDYDLAMLVFVPTADLWRDINTIRSLAQNWISYTVMPRFIVKDNNLELIKSPYKVGTQLYEENYEFLTDKLKSHLRQFDRYYFKSKYESLPVFGNLISYKLIARSLYARQSKQVTRNLMDPDSEAAQVSKKIFEQMRLEVTQDGKPFILIILPPDNDIPNLRNNEDYRMRWQNLVDAVCSGEPNCFDVTQELTAYSDDDLDKGYDGSHYGPKANRIIAELIGKKIDLTRSL